MYFGVCVTILVTASWVGATHCIKFLYIHRHAYPAASTKILLPHFVTDNETTNKLFLHNNKDSNASINNNNNQVIHFNAPFFASWFCTNFAILFFPIYLIGRITIKKCESPGEILGDVLRGFRDRGLTAGMFSNFCMFSDIIIVLLLK